MRRGKTPVHVSFDFIAYSMAQTFNLNGTLKTYQCSFNVLFFDIHAVVSVTEEEELCLYRKELTACIVKPGLIHD